MVIPMIAFIEGGMRIPMATFIRDYLRAHRLAPTQCAPNIFRILGNVDSFNEKMGLNLTHHNGFTTFTTSRGKGITLNLGTLRLDLSHIFLIPTKA